MQSIRFTNDVTSLFCTIFGKIYKKKLQNLYLKVTLYRIFRHHLELLHPVSLQKPASDLLLVVNVATRSLSVCLPPRCTEAG